RLLGLASAGKDVDQPRVVSEPCLGRANAPRRAIKEPGAEDLLELHDALAHRRAGKTELATGLGVASERNDLGKGLHGIELIHGHSLYPEWKRSGHRSIDCRHHGVNLASVSRRGSGTVPIKHSGGSMTLTLRRSPHTRQR